MRKRKYIPSNELIDRSEPFRNGFECGLLWNKLFNGGNFYKYYFSTENSAQVKMFCDYLKIECKIDVNKFTPQWSELTTHGLTEDPADSVTNWNEL